MKMIAFLEGFINVTVENVLPLKNAMSPMGFDPSTSHIVSHRSTNCAKGDFHLRSIQLYFFITTFLLLIARYHSLTNAQYVIGYISTQDCD